ncbi:DUF3866 family protein [Aneurinibacillus terranovensis]|uniref:DUF3866 family protein n=1 Tax=Aneurinibacillus terranovensis TaxID=278991 RepID=UPI00040313F7|nr:DUF3866 family protein [Aneurinibacillus terranovensis]
MQWAVGRIIRIVEETDAIQCLEVDVGGKISSAVHYPFYKGHVGTGDYVLLNTTAVSLSLGSGGYHFVMARFPADSPVSDNFPLKDADGKRSTVESHTGEKSATQNITTENSGRERGHIMKLRYTPYQFPVLAAEEPASMWHPLFNQATTSILMGIPVIIGELHSMLPVVCLALRHLSSNSIKNKDSTVPAGQRLPRICYIMSDSAALPMALSRHVAHLKAANVLSGTITYGHAFGGDSECVNMYTALQAAVLIWRADIIVITPGVGVVGTSTALGFSGMEQVSILQAVVLLGGTPILIPRVSFQDGRERHYGISHHTKTVLQYARNIPLHINMQNHSVLLDQWPACSPHHKLALHEPPEANVWTQMMAAYPEPITTMGRDYQKDPDFFAHCYFAAVDALGHI